MTWRVHIAQEWDGLHRINRLKGGTVNECAATNLLRDVYRAPEQRLDNLPGLGLWRPFDFAQNAISGVVDYNVQASEMVLGGFEGSLDLFLVRDVERDDEQL